VIKKVLVISFFPSFSPPRSGGELRLKELYSELGEFAQITLITSTDFGARQEEIRHKDGFREIRFPKDETWENAYRTLKDGGVEGELSGLAFALAVADEHCELRNAVRNLAKSADLVIHDFPYSEPIFTDGCPVPEIYNSHNFELGLSPTIVSGSGAIRIFSKLRRMEGRLASRARLVLATSQEDLFKFRLMYGVDESRLALSPNGFDSKLNDSVTKLRGELSAENSARRPSALFLGSAHKPNVDAGNFILDLAKEIPEVDFVLAGKVTGLLRWDKLGKNTKIIDDFSTEEKMTLLSEATIYLNPILEGSGTNIKTIEALAAGIPLISTPVGVRGLPVVAGVECLIGNREEFPSIIRDLLSKSTARENLSRSAIEFGSAGFSWSQLAQQLWRVLSKIDPGNEEHGCDGKPYILALNDYDVSSQNSGGAVRIVETLNALDQDVILVTYGDKFSVDQHGKSILHIVVPKGERHLLAARRASGLHPVSINDLVAGGHAPFDEFLDEIISAFAVKASLLVLEHCYMGTVLESIKKLNPDIAIVYSAHNVEMDLKAKLLRGHPLELEMLSFVTELEEAVCKEAGLIITCSDSDKRYFEKFGKDVILVQNGCSIPPTILEPVSPSVRPIIGFLGSAHPPNTAALEFILAELAPALTECDFEIIGSVCGDRHGASGNVKFQGTVDQGIKSQLMGKWTLALNPLASGGGTSLKFADYMAHGIPILTTPEGARGFDDVLLSKAAVVANLPQFETVIQSLISDRILLRGLSTASRRYAVENLSWKKATSEYCEVIDRMLNSIVPNLPPEARLLIVTYRYTEPALGGAEEYLMEISKRLRHKFKIIDLITPNIEKIGNFCHFGLSLSRGKGGSSRVIGEYFDQVKIFDPDFVPLERQFDLCQILEKDWRSNDALINETFLTEQLTAGFPVRISGFYDLEFLSGKPYRWTLGDFVVAVPVRTDILRIQGWSRYWKAGLVQIFERGSADTLRHVTSLRINFKKGDFVTDIKFPSGSAANAYVLKFKIDEHSAEDDHRPLGIQVQSLSRLTSRDRQDRSNRTFANVTGPTLLDGWTPSSRAGRGKGYEVETDFSLAVPLGCAKLSLVGRTELTVEIRAMCSGLGFNKKRVPEFDRVLKAGDFSVLFDIPHEWQISEILFEFTIRCHERAELNLFFDEVSIYFSGRNFPATLSTSGTPIKILQPYEDNIERSFPEELRRQHLPEWSRLNKLVAERRPVGVDLAFATVRGPHSAAMQNWILENAGNYDTVLVQGIPFDIIPSTIETLSNLPRKPRVVALPHFHGDDRFYYWKRYFDSFKSSDSTVLFSPLFKDCFVGSGEFAIVPGGGVSVYDTATIQGISDFRTLLGVSKPFFLVLGRKTPSKGYLRTVASWRAARGNGIDADLVFVGNDEDGLHFEDEGIHVLGLQPRAIALAAISECIAIISMSVSESFGIVICEAWAHSKPVIVNAGCYAFSDLVNHERNGLAVSSDEELQEAIERLATYPELAHQLGAEGALEVQEKYSWDRVAKLMGEILLPSQPAET
jgi:glycosyltransferase involved in cell wall biosynthesis